MKVLVSRFVFLFSHTGRQRLLLELLNKLDAQLKPEVVELAAQYEHRMQLGTKPIYHLEAFVAKFMSLYRKYGLRTVTATVP